MSKEAGARVGRWVDGAIIGLQLCPFAGRVVEQGSLRTAVCSSTDDDEAFAFCLSEAVLLLESSSDVIATSLLVLPKILADFDEFLSFAGAVEAALEDSGAAGTLQVATFHPDYRFGERDDDPADFSNRAPFPILHLLREDQVAEAIAGHPDAQGIPTRNIERLRAMGRAAIDELWQSWS